MEDLREATLVVFTISVDHLKCFCCYRVVLNKMNVSHTPLFMLCYLTCDHSIFCTYIEKEKKIQDHAIGKAHFFVCTLLSRGDIMFPNIKPCVLKHCTDFC
ncbi:hypothetical protein NE237_018646 [Protea cynaroides]|uniref:Uncharacterized protein n=1 Tax=Protea cynaroides TaxID=273540 RepID=A0A9Q0KAA6_9MAGN|nr:hypothetical protein NE237_018646 [Protea cynaroides]